MILPLAGIAATTVVCAALVPTDPSDSKRVVADLGLTPTAFAVSGFDASGCAAVLDRIKNSTSLQTVIDLKSQLRDQERQVAEIAKREREGAPAAEGAQTMTQARAAVEQTRVSLRATLDSMFTAVVADCTASLKAKLVAYRSNSAAGLPPDLRVVAWSAADLAALQKALLAETRANQGRDELKPEYRSLLESARARTEVVSARADLDANLAALTQQFESSLGS